MTPSTAADPYIALIRSCFDRNSNARVYYEQLIDFLQQRPNTPNPFPPCVIELHPSTTPISWNTRWDFFKEVPFQADLLASVAQGRSGTASSHGPAEPQAVSGRLFIVEGLPSPGVVSRLGARFQIRPELLIEHLDLTQLPSLQSLHLFNSTLPSRRENAIHIRFVTVGCSPTGNGSIRALASERAEAEQCRLRWMSNMLKSRRYGATMIRKVHFHDSATFSVEHLVSFCSYAEESGDWTGK
jgi:hypothetical protein